MTKKILKQKYYGYIYLILDQKHNKLYIGQKKGLVEKSHKYYGSSIIIKNIIKTRGHYFLKKYILGYCYTQEELNNCEKECIKFFNSYNPLYGYNRSEGGDGGDLRLGLSEKEKLTWKGKISKSTQGRIPWNKGLTKENDLRILKSSKSMKKHIRTEEHCLHISEANRGRVITKEWKKRISKATTKEKNPFYGKKHTTETKKKMSLLKKGLPSKRKGRTF